MSAKKQKNDTLENISRFIDQTRKELKKPERELAKAKAQRDRYNTDVKNLDTKIAKEKDKNKRSELERKRRIANGHYVDWRKLAGDWQSEVDRLQTRLNGLIDQYNRIKAQQSGKTDQNGRLPSPAGEQNALNMQPGQENDFDQPVSSMSTSPNATPPPSRYPTTARQQKPLPQLVRRDGNPLQPGEGR